MTEQVKLMMVPVILAGGSGRRLWPLSRSLFPKQFLALVSDKTLFQETLERLQGLDWGAGPIIVCNEEHRFLAAEQLRMSGIENGVIILEREGRNTAPALALAAIAAKDMGVGDMPLFVLPADHNITDVRGLEAAAVTAAEKARHGALVTFGIKPTRAETGYGYIRRGAADGGFFQVDKFVEKPDSATAEKYFASEKYFWNSGMFMFTADTFMDQLARFSPDIAETCKSAMVDAQRDGDFLRPSSGIFLTCRADSIDYAILEKTDRACILPLDVGWSDVGSWNSLWEIAEKEAGENVIHGNVLTSNTRGCYIRAENRYVAAVGLEDLAIIDTADALLVAKKSELSGLSDVVREIGVQNLQITTLHRKVYRPWGAYDCIDVGDNFQVKRITVNPGSKLSLQKHQYRAEHWIVVSGTALVTIDDQEMTLTDNQSTYIPIGAVHRLENIGETPLELIEVQSGSYLGEDDIVRLEDDYGRIPEITGSGA